MRLTTWTIHLTTFQRMFEETYTHGLNGEFNKHVNVVNIMLQGLRNGTIIIENGSFRILGEGQEQTIAVPVESITPLFLDQEMRKICLWQLMLKRYLWVHQFQVLID